MNDTPPLNLHIKNLSGNKDLRKQLYSLMLIDLRTILGTRTVKIWSYFTAKIGNSLDSRHIFFSWKIINTLLKSQQQPTILFSCFFLSGVSISSSTISMFKDVALVSKNGFQYTFGSRNFDAENTPAERKNHVNLMPGKSGRSGQFMRKGMLHRYLIRRIIRGMLLVINPALCLKQRNP